MTHLWFSLHACGTRGVRAAMALDFAACATAHGQPSTDDVTIRTARTGVLRMSDGSP